MDSERLPGDEPGLDDSLPALASSLAGNGSVGGRPGAEATETHGTGSAKTRQRILEAARQVFADRGVVDATVDDIVVRCDVSRGTFYYYCKNKGDVFEALVRQAVAELLAHARTPSTSEDPYTRIEAGNLGYLRIFAQYRDVLRNLFQVATIEPRFAALQQELRMSFVRPIRRSLERGVAAGRTRPLNPAVVAYGLGGMLDWVAYVWLGLDLIEDADVTVEEVARELSEVWYHALYGGRPHACGLDGASGRLD